MQLPLRNSPAQQGFVIFTCVRVNENIPPFTGECFSLFPFAGFICCGPCWLGMSACLPTTGKQRFDSVTQHNDSQRIAWKNSPYDNLPRYSRLSMK
nr:MAG TPA: hypothetical protein [Caudoviricetes sp.]